LPEMLWTCHVASALIGAGILLSLTRPVAVGLLFQVSIGIPAYLLDAISSGTTTPSSVAVHLVPPLLGFLSLRRAPYPPRCWLYALALFLAMQLVSYLATPPSLNVNVSHAPWPPFDRIFPAMWSYSAFNAALALILLLAGDALLRRVLRRAPPSIPKGAPT